MPEVLGKLYLVLLISLALGIAETIFPKLIKHSGQKEFGEFNG